MNLEEYLKIKENNEKIEEILKENKELEDKIAKMQSNSITIKNSNFEENNQELEEKQKSDNAEYKMPSEDDDFQQINSDESFTKTIKKAEEEMNKRMQNPTKLSKLFDDAYANLNENLILDKLYRGKIADVKIVCSKYNSIVISYEVQDDGCIKYVSDTFMFNGEYDDYNASRLVKYLSNIDGFYKDDIIAYTVEDIKESLMFLVGANISIKQYENEKGYRCNQVTVLGTYDRMNKRMVEE